MEKAISFQLTRAKRVPKQDRAALAGDLDRRPPSWRRQKIP